METILVLTWLGACFYVLISLVFPLPPFKTRLRTLLAGPFFLLFVTVVVAISFGRMQQGERTSTTTLTPGTLSKQRQEKAVDRNSLTQNAAKRLPVQVQQKARPVAMEPTYDPQTASEATGYTIRKLDEHQLLLVGHAAQFVTMMKWCNYSYFLGDDNPVKADVSKLGVHPFDFKNLVRKTRHKTLQSIQANTSWRAFCGKEIYQLFGKQGQLFGPNGEYPNAGPWIKHIEVKPGMTKQQVEAEVELNVAYYGAVRCLSDFTDLDEKKEQAYKKRHHLNDKWYEASSGQYVAFNNETFFRLGPESLMNFTKYRRKYRKLWPRK